MPFKLILMLFFDFLKVVWHSFFYYVAELIRPVMTRRLNEERDTRMNQSSGPGAGNSGPQTNKLSSRERYDAKHGKRQVLDEESESHLRNKERQMRRDQGEPTKGS